MSNPFDFLRQRREKSESAGKEHSRREQALQSERRQVYSRYDNTVKDVLTKLRAAYYPKEKVEIIREGDEWFNGYRVPRYVWCIGGIWISYDGPSLEYKVMVTLQFDELGQPWSFKFDAKNYGSGTTPDPSKENLVKSLVAVYSQHST